ncbi:MAG: BatA domain-containing protein [Planctomycetes bacterium]|nr:BatA domain-containing protein [Planctomycetota bacterium]
MTFLNPMMLFGGLAVGIPLALHFFYRAHYRPVPWAAMKFLRLSVEQTSRRMRFQELILLLLRIVVCLLLAFALARPSADSLTSHSGRGESVDAILLIDVSYSMSALEGEGKDRRSRFDRAKEAAIKVIDHLPPESTVRIVACTDKAVAMGPLTPSNLDEARHLVRNLKLTSMSTDFAAGFSEAVVSFENKNGVSKEVYLFSDMQRSGWDRQTSFIRAKCDDIKNQASLYLVRCSDTDSKLKNVAIEGILPQTEIPHIKAPTNFTVLLRNTGVEKMENIKVTLQVDNKDIDKSYVTVDKIEPGQTRPLTMTVDVKEVGWHLFTARIEANNPEPEVAAPKDGAGPAPMVAPKYVALQDDIEEDNTFRRSMHVHEKIRILLIDGNPDDNPLKTGTYFLGHALLPIPEVDKENYHLRVAAISPEAANPGSLEGMDICVLVNVTAANLSEDFVKRLNRFVRDGKGLLITSGSHVKPKDYNERLADLLPTPLLDEAPYHAPLDNPATPDLESLDIHSFLATLKEGGLNQLSTLNVAFTKVILPVEDPRNVTDNKDLGRVLLRFNDNRPMLLSRSVGSGEVMLLTTSVDPSWSILSQAEGGFSAFFPFIKGCVTHLVQRAKNPYDWTAGDKVRWTPPDPNLDYDVIPPDGERVLLGKAKAFEDKMCLNAFDSSHAGLYWIVEHGPDAEAQKKLDARGQALVFNPDLRESQSLETISDKSIEDQLGFVPVHLKTGFDGSQFTGTERSRGEWTIWFLTALLIFALGETLWAWFCGRAW